MIDKKFIQLAIEKAKEGIGKGQTPFAACIVKDSKVISCAHNTVWKANDVTAHAEINAIRMACKKLNSIDLSGCTVYSTTEPCPMCFSACHWARISGIVYGTSINDSRKNGFNELSISNSKMKSIGQTDLEVVGSFARDECLELFEIWSHQKDKKPY
jgi:tRNA(Arg) A34 adenosine deaminase TadA